VKFVIATGDLTQTGTVEALRTRATWAQPLYDAGIGFFPLRGNHDDFPIASTASEFVRLFPQTRDGVQNRTPTDGFDWTDSAFLHPTPPKQTPTFSVGTAFSSPSPRLGGLSYAFAHENATFVLLDQFRTADPAFENLVRDQLPWIDSVLANRPKATHAFVLGHKGIVTENHPDNLFGSDPSQDSASTNRFLRSLWKHDVRWYIGGHDHLHNRALISTTNDTAVRIQGIILASDSYKFYQPYSTSIDSTFDVPAYGRARQVQLSQDLHRIGYTIVTVDGPLVTAEHWATPVMSDGSSLVSIPDLSDQWTLRETYGYSLNGRQFLVPQGEPYTVVTDSGEGTRMRILAGTNSVASTDYSRRAFFQQVSVGWKAQPAMASASTTLWGMRLALGDERTPPFVLSMSFDRCKTDFSSIASGKFALLRKQDGIWYNAAATNTDGIARFALRPWSAGDPLGTYGIDTATGSAWCVLDRAGEFAVGTFGVAPPPPPPRRFEGKSISITGGILMLPSSWSNANAMVELRSWSGRALHSIRTDNGRADLRQIPTGAYSLQAIATGRSTLTARLFLP